MLSYLASSTFFKYAQNEGFAFKKFKIFMGGHAPKVSGHLGTWISRYPVLEILVLNNKNNLIEFKNF
jgi:hypothetical protein